MGDLPLSVKGAGMSKKQVAVNARGYRIGETHHRAKLADADIELILYLREEGLTYAQIASKFDDGLTVSKSTVRDVIKGRIRGQLPSKYKVCG